MPESETDAQSQLQFKSAGPLPDVPLIVLARGQADAPGDDQVVMDFEETWRKLQVDLANQTQGGDLFIAEMSGLIIHKDQPNLVISDIRKMMERVN